MSGKKGPEPEPEPEPSSTHSALDHVEAHAETRADEHSRLVSKASADVSSIGLGSMEAQMAAARAEMEEQIRKEEEEKEARRKGKRVGGGRRKREERKEGVPLTAPSLSGRPRSRPGSASKSPRLPPLQHVPQQPGAEDRAAAADELTREQQMRDYPAYDGGGDGGGPPPDGGARGALLTSDLVTVGAPALDYQVLNDALLSVGPPVDELRTDLEDDAPFTERVHNLIDARIAPPITDIYRTLAKREQEFQAFATMVTGRLEKLESELATTKQQLAAERLERKQEASALAARVLRAESTLTEKAEQQELDALLKSVITTIGTSRHPFLPRQAELFSIRAKNSANRCGCRLDRSADRRRGGEPGCVSRRADPDPGADAGGACGHRGGAGEGGGGRGGARVLAAGAAQQAGAARGQGGQVAVRRGHVADGRDVATLTGGAGALHRLGRPGRAARARVHQPRRHRARGNPPRYRCHLD